MSEERERLTIYADLGPVRIPMSHYVPLLELTPEALSSGTSSSRQGQGAVIPTESSAKYLLQSISLLS